MNKNEILKKVIAKLEEMKDDLKNELDEELKKLEKPEEQKKSEEKIAAILDQVMLNDFILKLKMLTSPEKVKNFTIAFDDTHNENQEQKIRLKILNEIKKEDLFRFKEIKGMREMWRKLVTQEWEIHYLFGEL